MTVTALEKMMYRRIRHGKGNCQCHYKIMGKLQNLSIYKFTKASS